MRIAIVVATGPERGELVAAAALARAARAAGDDVTFFFMDDGVASAAAARGVVEALADDGCELWACATSAADRGLDEAAVGALLGSQDDHAAAVHRAERVVAFT